MAQRVTTTYVSDLSGEEVPDESPTVAFSLDGRSYTIDLTASEAETFRAALQPYLDVARSAGRTRSKGASVRRSASSAAAVREWAQANGHPVPERGRLPKEIREAYEAAH